VTLETAPAFITAGAVAVGMGGWLIGDGDPAGIRARARQVTTAVAEARAERPAATTTPTTPNA
jgi:2-keto-3-deoxy-6-phosphogluconate aldolase